MLLQAASSGLQIQLHITSVKPELSNSIQVQFFISGAFL